MTLSTSWRVVSALTMRRYSPPVLYVSSDVPGFPADHQQVETVALLDTGQDALRYPKLCVLRAGLHELPGVLATGECRTLQGLYMLLCKFHRYSLLPAG